MAEILRKAAIDEIKKIRRADIVVGIPSFKNQATIEGVVKAAAEGLIKYFPELKPVIVNSDGASTHSVFSVYCLDFYTSSHPQLLQIYKVLLKELSLTGNRLR